jgi:endonuclease/exonuclease/phosphatase family metal-dependent hydrolase
MSLKTDYLTRIGNNPYGLRKKNGLRIATYNVHYWCDVNEKNTLSLILQDIKYINADIICLQEAIVGSIYNVENGIINTEHVIYLLEEMGYYILFCNNVPTWFNSVYGNMMCVKKKIATVLKNDNLTIHTFEKSTQSCLVSGDIKGVPETRCFIQFEFLNYLIICTHLDVCSEHTRLKQIDYILKIIKASSKKIILLGDFNSTDIKDYSDTQKLAIINYIYNNNTKHIHNNSIQKIKLSGMRSVITVPTTWSNIQSDYIFIRGIKHVYSQVLYTPHSDHLPLIVDIKSPKTKKVFSP